MAGFKVTNSSLLCDVLHIEIITLTIIHPLMLGSLPYLGPAYNKALDRIRYLYPSLNVTQTIVSDVSYRSCQDLTADAVNRIAPILFKKDSEKNADSCSVAVLMSGGCNEVYELYLLSEYLDVLLISSVAATGNIHKTRLTPTWICISVNNLSTYSSVYLNLAEILNWVNFGMITDDGANPYFALLSGVVYSQLSKAGKQIIDEHINTMRTKEPIDYGKILLRLSSFTRVILYFGEPNGFRKLLVNAVQLNMTSADYVYIITTPFRFSTEPGYLTWKKEDKDDEIVRLAYRSVLIIEPEVYGNTEGSNTFSSEMKNLSKAEYNYTYKPYESVSPHPQSTYAGMVIFAQIMENLHASSAFGTWSSGKKLAKKFLNSTFATDVGNFFIDSVGDRVPTALINQLDWNTSEIRTIFMQNPSTLRLEYASQPQWPGIWPPANEPKCGFRGDALICRQHGNTQLYGASSGGLALIIILVAVIISGLYRRAANERLLNNDSWKIEPGVLCTEDHKPIDRVLLTKDHTRTMTMKYRNDQSVFVIFAAEWRTTPGSKEYQHQTRALILLVNQLRKLDHPNINRFIGICVVENTQMQSLYFVSDYASRGLLTELTSRMSLDYDMQIALIFDVLKGAEAIQRSSIRYHGNLSSRCCYIDKHFTLKIGEAGLAKLKLSINAGSRSTESSGKNSRDFAAVGLILIHIITLEDPFINQEKIKTKLKEKQEYPFPQKFINMLPLIRSCVDEELVSVSDIAVLIRKATAALDLKASHAKDTQLFERIVRRLEEYTMELDHQVAVRTLALVDERRKCETVLREMLPVGVIEQLRKGTFPEAESFDSATVLFTEVSGFKGIVEQSQPAAVMMFLNDVYTAFDSALLRFDVYKVETIKDSYMVVSGVPVRNGKAHGKEICRLAIALLRAYSPFEALFEKTSLRAGIHTGPCAAGVVGHRAPRYCLFGDTVNTASRMLMYSHDSRIHLSESTYILLHSNFPEFNIQNRGMVDVKGKGLIATYWLNQQVTTE